MGSSNLSALAARMYAQLNVWTGCLSIIFIFFCGTYLFTTFRFALGSLSHWRNERKQPLTLPYWIPFIGSSILMGTDGHAFYESAMKKSGGPIVGARLGPMYVYLIAGAKNVQTIFRNSRSMSADFLILEVYRNVVGLPKRDLAIFEVDDSGSAAAPLTNVPEERRIWRHIHHAHGPNLQSTRGLEVLTKVFTREFLEVVNRQPLDEWTTTPIYRFFRNEMSTASGIALIGRGPFIHNPRLMEDFWEFFAGFMSLFLGLPRFMAPKIFDARTRMVDACVSTLKSIEGRYESIQAKNLDWDEDLGSRVNQDREKAMIDCGLSIEGRGAMMAGFLIGVNGNAIPIASWILLEAIQDAKLLMALREEIMTAVMQNKESPEDIHLDIPKLLSLPLLSSVYTETLRLRISTTATRKLRNDLEVDGYILKAGNMVMVPSWLAHTDDEWSTPSHPATSFWARRFLEGDGTVTSGKPISATHPGKYFPFGGGSSMCPGRFFAKQEVLAAVALMIAKFEMEFVGYVTHEGKKSERGPRPDLKNAGSGALVPDGDLMVRLRRRM